MKFTHVALAKGLTYSLAPALSYSSGNIRHPSSRTLQVLKWGAHILRQEDDGQQLYVSEAIAAATHQTVDGVWNGESISPVCS